LTVGQTLQSFLLTAADVQIREPMHHSMPSRWVHVMYMHAPSCVEALSIYELPEFQDSLPVG